MSDGVAGWATELGSAAVTMPVTLALMLWMVIRRNWAAAIYIFMTVAVGWFLGNDVDQERHSPAATVRRQHRRQSRVDFSMPSGHSLAAFLMLATLCVIVMLNLPGRSAPQALAGGRLGDRDRRALGCRACISACTGSATCSRRGFSAGRGGRLPPRPTSGPSLKSVASR